MTKLKNRCPSFISQEVCGLQARHACYYPLSYFRGEGRLQFKEIIGEQHDKDYNCSKHFCHLLYNIIHSTKYIMNKHPLPH